MQILITNVIIDSDPNFFVCFVSCRRTFLAVRNLHCTLAHRLDWLYSLTFQDSSSSRLESLMKVGFDVIKFRRFFCSDLIFNAELTVADHRMHPTYIMVYIYWTQIIATIVIPMAVLVFCNFKVEIFK